MEMVTGLFLLLSDEDITVMKMKDWELLLVVGFCLLGSVG